MTWQAQYSIQIIVHQINLLRLPGKGWRAPVLSGWLRELGAIDGRATTCCQQAVDYYFKMPSDCDRLHYQPLAHHCLPKFEIYIIILMAA